MYVCYAERLVFRSAIAASSLVRTHNKWFSIHIDGVWKVLQPKIIADDLFENKIIFRVVSTYINVSVFAIFGIFNAAEIQTQSVCILSNKRKIIRFSGFVSNVPT